MSASFGRLLISFIFVAFGVATTAGCNDRPVRLTILHTNDIHSTLRAPKENPYGLGGLARLKTLIDTRKSIHGSQPTLLLDAGDFSEGNIVYSIDQGRSMVNALTRMGYDATVLGNHDFLDGPQSLLEMLAFSPRVSVLTANLNVEGFPNGRRLQEELLPYKVFRFGDLAVGVIGLTTFEFTYASYMEPVKITDPVPVATALAQTMHAQGVQAIILLSHNSIEYNKTLARQVPWVTAVISGHSHVKTPEPVFVRNAGRDVPVVEAGKWGGFLGELNLDIVPKTGTTTYVSYTLHPVAPHLPENPSIKQMVDDIENRIRSRFGRDVYADHVAHTDDWLPHVEDRESTLSNFLAESYRTAIGTDIAFDVASLQGLGLTPGDITTADVYNLMPHIPSRHTGATWTLKRLTLTGRELEVVLNLWVGIGNYDIPITGQLSMAGVQLTAQPAGLNPVRGLLVGGEPLNAGRDYTVALHDGFLLILMLVNDRVHLGLNLSRVEDSGVEAWQAAARTLYQQGVFRAANHAPGRNLRYLMPDLAWSEHAARWERQPTGAVRMTVPVRNVGMETMPSAARAIVKVGPLNDYAREGTALESLTPLNTTITIPALAPGEEALVDIIWTNPSLLPGVQAVEFSLADHGTYDRNRTNDRFRLHITRPAVVRRASLANPSWYK